MDIFCRKIRKVGEDLGFGHATSEVFEHVVDRDAGSLDARLPASNIGIDGDTILPTHGHKCIPPWQAMQVILASWASPPTLQQSDSRPLNFFLSRSGVGAEVLDLAQTVRQQANRIPT